MDSVDDLIGDLFPAKTTGSHSSAVAPPTLQVSTWDDSDVDDAHEKQAPRQVRSEPPVVSKRTQPSRVEQRHATCSSSANQHKSIVHSFDQDSDEDMGGLHPTAAQKSVFTVAFPSGPPISGLPSCTNRCFVTNCGAALKHIPPSVEQLQKVAAGKYDGSSSQAVMMNRKAAYYLEKPSVGNACADCGPNNGSADATGGCPFILCRRCNYVVIRLQGAKWCDREGTLDLYLTTRNFYPDWSRLASALPVGVPDGNRHGCVLRTSTKAAAYCCQCSWLTVYGPHEVVETRLTDAASMAEGTSLFATELPLRKGETRRPPLWFCKGHAV